jgi:GAF domain-containing protein
MAEGRRSVDNRELWLATTMVDLAEAFDADPDEGGHARLLVTRLAELLGPSEVGLLIADDAGLLSVTAASTDRAGDLAWLQARHHEGPGVDSYRTGQSLVNERVPPGPTRWPRFAQAARAAGVGIVSALPMLRRDQTIGVICATAGAERRLNPADVSLAQVLARTAALAIAQQRDLRRSVQAAEQLRRALDSRILIEQAKGAVAARLAITPDEAFVLLRGYARRASRAMAEIADETIRGTLPVHDLVAAHEARRGRAGRTQHVGQSW